MSQAQIVFAIYRPAPGKERELETLVRKHYPTLKEYGLATDRPTVVAKSSDGSFIEVFEWVSESAAEKAHTHPAVAKIWEAMGTVGEFGTLASLPEAGKRFPHFAPIV